MSKEFLSVQNLSVEFAKGKSVVQAVNGLSFTLAKGETLGLVGETGAGKTTTALSIMNLVPGPAGRIVSGPWTFRCRIMPGADQNDVRIRVLSRAHGHHISTKNLFVL